MLTTKKLWLLLGLVVGLSFSVLIYFGVEIYRVAPPIPGRVVDSQGKILFTGQDIKDGQNIWQSIGGQSVGSIWGHGSYVAPDWSADWLHREAVSILDALALTKYHSQYSSLTDVQQAELKVIFQKDIRLNTYNSSNGELSLNDLRVAAINSNSQYYQSLFMNDPAFKDLRSAYAIPSDSIKTEERMRKMNAFFFWAAWTCTTTRPGEKVTYTNNWPPEELVGNRPDSSLLIWTGFSVIILILGIGVLGYYHASHKEDEISQSELPKKDPLLAINPTPSMKAVVKYFWVVTALILVQILVGAISAHYGVEGDGFYGFPLSKYLPFAVTRTWHVQLGIFWIATSWLATGLFIAPAVSGHEPKFQKTGCRLFICRSHYHCCRFYDRTMVRDHAKTGSGNELPFWSPRL